MDERVKKLWTGALRGEVLDPTTQAPYCQAQGALKVGDCMCCLGVLSDLYRADTGEGRWDRDNQFVYELAEEDIDQDDPEAHAVGYEDSDLPYVVAAWAGLDDDTNPDLQNKDGQVHSAAEWNDGNVNKGRLDHREPASFAEIADMIDSTL